MPPAVKWMTLITNTSVQVNNIMAVGFRLGLPIAGIACGVPHNKSQPFFKYAI